MSIGDVPNGFLSEEVLSDILVAAVNSWLELHGSSSEDLDPLIEVTKFWLEPLIVALDVTSPLFAQLSAPNEGSMAADIGEYSILCGLTPDGLRVLVQYNVDTAGREKAPESVASFLPLGNLANKMETAIFLHVLWNDWVEKAELTHASIDIIDTSSWKTNTTFGVASYEWLQTLGDTAVLFNTPLVSEHECREFMSYAEALVVDGHAVATLANPFLTRGDEGQVTGNMFVLLVAEVKN